MKDRNTNPTGRNKPSRRTVRRVAVMLATFIAVFAVYVLIIRSETQAAFIAYCAYYVFFTVLLAAVILLNGGFTKDIPEPSQLRDSWSDEQKEKFIRRLTAGKKWARRLMYLLVPMMATVMFDLIYTFWLSSLLSGLGG